MCSKKPAFWLRINGVFSDCVIYHSSHPSRTMSQKFCFGAKRGLDSKRDTILSCECCFLEPLDRQCFNLVRARDERREIREIRSPNNTVFSPTCVKNALASSLRSSECSRCRASWSLHESSCFGRIVCDLCFGGRTLSLL